MREPQDIHREQRSTYAHQQNTQRFGNYDLVRRIDVGGMGEVYLAHQRTAFGREVAVKIIRSDLAHDITVRKRFLREAEVNAHLKHDHILPLIEFSEHEGRLFLVTPYIKGGTLAHRLQAGSLSPDEVHQLFSALVQAVAYIHKRGVIHRDLKPSNILLDREEDGDQVYVRLIDFGIASIPGAAASAPLTTADHEIGTVAYMAPERLDGIAATSNDIYSLGVILFQMLTGTLPSKETPVAIPQPMEYVVRRCLMRDPIDRFENADELLQAFERAYQVMRSSPRYQTEGSTESSARPAFTGRSRPSGPITREHLLFHRADLVYSPHVKASNQFGNDDYNAPTSSVNVSHDGINKQLANEAAFVTHPAITGKPRKYSLTGITGIISLGIIALLVTISGIGYLTFRSSISAEVTITPQVQTISQVLFMTAKPELQSTDPATASLPARILNSDKTTSMAGPTSGIADCILGIFGCKQAVSFTDVTSLAMQEKAGVKDQIAQDLRNQLQNSGQTMVGNIVYTDGNVVPNPDVGTVSKTVTVTLTERGSVEAVKTQDIQNLAYQMLNQKLPQGYTLISHMTHFGQPVMQSLATDGTVKIALAVSSIAHYQFSPAILSDIQNHIKGMTAKDARSYIAHLAGVDGNVIGIHISFGDTIPSDTPQIKVISTDPPNLPEAPLPQVPATQAPTQTTPQQ